MAFSQQDYQAIYYYLGVSATFLQAEPQIQAAINATQSQADGGSRPDSNAENYIKSLLYGSVAQTGPAGVTLGPTAQNVQFTMPATIGLIAIDQQLSTLWQLFFVQSADKEDVVLDTGRALVLLRMEGRRLAFRLARALGLRSVRADVFGSRNAMGDGPSRTETTGYPFAYDFDPID
jgi:hypothetical protein